MAKQTLGLEVQSSDSREVQINGTLLSFMLFAEAKKKFSFSSKKSARKSFGIFLQTCLMNLT
jgi:hypothetical protein